MSLRSKIGAGTFVDQSPGKGILLEAQDSDDQLDVMDGINAVSKSVDLVCPCDRAFKHTKKSQLLSAQ